MASASSHAPHQTTPKAGLETGLEKNGAGSSEQPTAVGTDGNVVPRTATGAIDLRAWRDTKWRRLVAKNEHHAFVENRGPIPGELPGLHILINDLVAVDESYRADPRFTHLASDPAHDHAIRPHSIQEALAALAAERAGQIKAPVMRAPDASLDFVDGAGRPIDVKTPKSPSPHEEWQFDVKEALASIKSQLQVKATNANSGRPQGVIVLLDTTYLSKDDYQSLARAMRQELTPGQQRRVIRTSVPTHRLQYDPNIWRNKDWWERVAATPHLKVSEKPGQVPGDHVGAHQRLTTVAAVDCSYREDPRFIDLARDPGHNGAIRPQSLQDAMAIFTAERARILRPPVRRATHIDHKFVDALGRTVSVKTPKSPGPGENWTFDAQLAAQSIERALDKSAPHPVTYRERDVDVILDTTYLSGKDHQALSHALDALLPEDQRQRIVALSVPDHRLSLDGTPDCSLPPAKSSGGTQDKGVTRGPDRGARADTHAPTPRV